MIFSCHFDKMIYKRIGLAFSGEVVETACFMQTVKAKSMKGGWHVMTISLKAAEQIGDFTVFGFGFGLVFVGLICIILICSIVGALCKSLIKDKGNGADTAVVQDAGNLAPAAVSGGYQDKGEFVAAVSAAIAEELGTDVTGIRVLSIKKLS